MDRQIITVDIAPGSDAQQRLQVSQGDIGRPLGVRIIQSGLPLNCTGYTAHLYVLKPDHNYYECTCTISNNNLISWDTAEQETPVAGECLAEIRITSGTNDIGTACFVEYVEASPADLGYASESLISSMAEYVDAAQQAAEEATEIVEDYDNVNDVAVDSSGHIVLTKVHGSTVTSDETVMKSDSTYQAINTSIGEWPPEITTYSLCYIMKIGRMCLIHLNLKIESSTKKSMTIGGCIPAGYRPLSDAYFTGGDGDTDGVAQPIVVANNGNITIWNTKTGTTYAQCTAMYFV